MITLHSSPTDHTSAPPLPHESIDSEEFLPHHSSVPLSRRTSEAATTVSRIFFTIEEHSTRLDQIQVLDMRIATIKYLTRMINEEHIERYSEALGECSAGTIDPDDL